MKATWTYQERVHLLTPFHSREFIELAIRSNQAVFVVTEDALGKMKSQGLQMFAKCVWRFNRIREGHVGKEITDP